MEIYNQPKCPTRGSTALTDTTYVLVMWSNSVFQHHQLSLYSTVQCLGSVTFLFQINAILFSFQNAEKSMMVSTKAA